MTLQSKLAMGWDKHTVVKFSQRSDVHIFAFSFRSGITMSFPNKISLMPFMGIFKGEGKVD